MRKLAYGVVLCCCLARAAAFHVYVGQLESRSVLLAWGTMEGRNTIGRSSASLGRAHVSLGSRTRETSQNWALVDGLEPNTAYSYKVTVSGNQAAGNIRTFPELATAMRFFVIGDYGNGTEEQRAVATVIQSEFQRLSTSDNPPRFVLTTGDNIYADLNLGFEAIHSGENDSDWHSKFFDPYAAILKEIPFYPSPGNHDGNGSENRADLAAYLDNFFFPGNAPARWYTFRFADLAQFFSLDSTKNSLQGRPKSVYAEDGKQFAWFRKTIAESSAPWKIPYFHNPPFNAGPFHGASYEQLKHFCQAFVDAGVRVVFTGHEHNFQVSDQDAATGNIAYVITGAGGELRAGDVRGRMERAHITAWAAERHFLSVEIEEGGIMRITPIGPKPVEPVDRNGQPVALPIVVRLAK